LGVQRIFARFSPDLPEKIFQLLPANFQFSPTKTFFCMTSKKRSSCVVGRHFLNLKTLDAIFQIFRNFAWIGTNQNFWDALVLPAFPSPTPLPPTLKIKDGRKRSASRARATKILQQGHGEKIQLGEEPTASVVCHKVRYLSGDRTTLPLKFEQEHPGKLTAVVDDN